MTLINTPASTTAHADTTPTSYEDFLQVLSALSLNPPRVTVDLTCQAVTVQGAAVELTNREFCLLAFLADNADRIVPRLDILNEVWDGAVSRSSRTLDAHILRLRKKLGEDGLISTVRGEGYRFNSSPRVRVVAERATTLAA